MALCVCGGICPKRRDSNENPVKKRGGGSRKRPSEAGHLVLPTPAGSLPPRENYPRDRAKNVFRRGTGRLGFWLRPATWPPWRAVPGRHEHEASPTGPGTPSPARWGPALLPKGSGDLGPPRTEGAPPCGGTQRDLSVLSAGARGRRRSLQRLG